MRKWQAKFHPRLKLSGKTLDEIQKALEEQDHSFFTKYGFEYDHHTVESELKTILVKVGDKTHMIIYDPKFASAVDNTEYFFLDGTFSIVPRIKNVKQFLTIMVQKVDKVGTIKNYYTIEIFFS